MEEPAADACLPQEPRTPRPDNEGAVARLGSCTKHRFLTHLLLRTGKHARKKTGRLATTGFIGRMRQSKTDDRVAERQLPPGG
ncbi:hypothetical protein XBLMG947_1381 [Xanthomonas bromi]|uniref:Uncharacterized protein n=1 Tax=Xanthomonas bromi TaxID=56449 RepID=A0A1C3NJR3_9XANT|nr:hypothetical protein XbrCFBP1976_08290 [Xanthomonas bromi]SBV50601.1 hypothetical protein XBLMG947_1381 [Xanthomonas bromi]